MTTKAQEIDIEELIYTQLRLLRDYARAGCICAALTAQEQKELSRALSSVLKEMPE